MESILVFFADNVKCMNLQCTKLNRVIEYAVRGKRCALKVIALAIRNTDFIAYCEFETY